MSSYSHVSQVYDLVYRERTDDAAFYGSVVARSVAGSGARRVIEIGAGTGRVLLPIARAHPEVSFTALDMDHDELAVLQGKVGRAGIPNVEVVCLDLAQMAWKEHFDLVMAPFRVLQHCLSAEDLSTAFSRIWSALKPGGTFAFDLFNPSIPALAHSGLVVSQDFVDAAGTEINRTVYVNERSYFDQIQHIEEYYRVFDAPGQTRNLSWVYDTRYFFKGEVEPLLLSGGFSIDAVHGDFKGTPFGQGVYPGDLVFVAAKPL
ncbi:MAG: class I SAM-dependent methyltransferase [Pseudonocardiaceae bacterium]